MSVVHFHAVCGGRAALISVLDTLHAVVAYMKTRLCVLQPPAIVLNYTVENKFPKTGNVVMS